MSLGRFTVTVTVSVWVAMVLADIKITDEEALQTAANGGPIDSYVKTVIPRSPNTFEANALV